MVDMVIQKLRTQMRWIILAIVVAFLLSTFLMYEGRRTRRGPRPSSNGAMEDYEVAQVNGRPLMRSELEQRLRNYLENYGQRGTASLDMPALYKSLLDQYAFELKLARETTSTSAPSSRTTSRPICSPWSTACRAP